MVVFSLIFSRSGGFFVDFSSKWCFFRGCFVEVVVLFMDVSSKWWFFRRNGGFVPAFFLEVVVFWSLSDPNGPINSKYTFFQRFLFFNEATGPPEKVCTRASRTVREGVGGG